MRILGIGLAVAMLAGSAFAQQAAPIETKTFTSETEIKAMMEKAKNERKPDQANFIQHLLHLAPYTANLEYRAGVGPAAVHEHEAEFFIVLDGSGTLVTGGKLVNEKRANPENLNGTGIEGGESRNVAKGDVFVVPENTPHWFSKVNGTLVLMSLHVPRPVPGHQE